MNTVRMLLDAEKNVLPRYKIVAECLWALVSQAGRGSLTVGQISKMCLLTSGFKPSTYQVKEIMLEFYDMDIIKISDGPTRGKGTERVYAANPSSIAALACYTYALSNDEVRKAASELTNKVFWESRKKFHELAEYNKKLEAENESAN